MRIPQKPPTFTSLITALHKVDRWDSILQAVSSPTSDGQYLHWDDLRFRKPPNDLTHEDWWLGLKFRRQAGYRSIPLKNTAGQQFHFNVPDLVTDLLHQIDRGGGTYVEIPE